MANLFTANFAADIKRILHAFGFSIEENGDSLTAWSRGGTPLYLHIVEDQGGRQFLRLTGDKSPDSLTLAEFTADTLRAWLNIAFHGTSNNTRL